METKERSDAYFDDSSLKDDADVLRSLQTGCPGNGLQDASSDGAKHPEPGVMVAKVLQFLYPRKTYEKVFKETVLDFRTEVKECSVAKQPWRARWMYVVYHVSLANIVISHASSNTIGKVYRSVFGNDETSSVKY